MPRETYHRELDLIHDRVMALAASARRAVDESVRSLRTADRGWSQRIDAADAEINGERLAVEERCIALIAAQQPVAVDLRRLASTLFIISEIERIADHAVGIARINLMMAVEPAPRPLSYLPSMCDRALAMFDDAVRAFDSDDVALARQVCRSDDDLDRLQDRVYADVIEAMRASAETVERNTYLLWAAHNLERIGDRCTNIGERVVYTVTGEMKDTNVSTF
jgi:phosphate transport system protein